MNQSDGSGLREFLELPYERLEEMNLRVKEERLQRIAPDQARETRVRYLHDEKRLKAVTVCFTDLEGRLHMLDYDKKHLLRAEESLTFDGSSIRGFSAQAESDLRLSLDWSAFYWLPADIFGGGKVLLFGEVLERDGTPYEADLRSRLKRHLEALHAREALQLMAATEIEGFLFKGCDAERNYPTTGRFEFVSTGGYYHSLPGDTLRTFIDHAAEAQRAMGFQNEKDHPEVAPSQFEMNFSHTEALVAADQVQLYKLLCRQVAAQHGLTASFLPKPVTSVNGNGMHTNLSLAKDGRNLFHDKSGVDGLSAMGWKFVERVLEHGAELCLALNSSVNAYRRLDPHFEAPNQIMASANNRGAMVRIPYANERSARIEVRSVAPDSNPYLVLYALLCAGLPTSDGRHAQPSLSQAPRFLPDNIYDAIDAFAGSKLMSDCLGDEIKAKYSALKLASAERCPKRLGAQIKTAEIQFHHEVTNQHLWAQF